MEVGADDGVASVRNWACVASRVTGGWSRSRSGSKGAQSRSIRCCCGCATSSTQRSSPLRLSASSDHSGGKSLQSLFASTGELGGAGGIERASGTKNAWKPFDRSTLTSSETCTLLCLPVVLLIFLGSCGRCFLLRLCDGFSSVGGGEGEPEADAGAEDVLELNEHPAGDEKELENIGRWNATGFGW